jgi:chromosome segregation ATPase
VASREAGQKYRQVREATEQAMKEVAEIKAERDKEERELGAYRKKAGAEKKRIDHELEEYQEQANVTEQEMNAAAELKAQVGSCGFSLEEMLGLSKEFAGYQDARKSLAEGLKNCCSLTRYVKALEKWAEERKRVVESELANLESQRNWQQTQVKSLTEARDHLETVIARLQADVVGEEEMTRFYQWDYGFSRLTEYLAGIR